MENWTQTFSGKKIDFLNPDPEQIVIEDIAHALSLQNRFNGHTKAPYSVAQHSLMVMRHCPEGSELEGLMHDASEAYMSDLVSPLKALCPDYRVIEGRLAKVINDKFSLTSNVKSIDLRALATERRDLMPHLVGNWSCLDGVVPFAETVIPMPWEVCEMMFLRAFKFYDRADCDCKK